MPFLPGSQNTIISGGSFVDISTINGQTGIDILLEASNRDAAHDSSARDYAPRCHPGTRGQHIDDIVYWAIPSDGVEDPLPLFWMKGPAGVGKSAIAQTCAEKLNDLGVLGAAFFFSLNGRDEAAEFIPTIVYQLSIKFPDYRDLVDQIICHHKAILDKTMTRQFEALIVEPLQELERTGREIGKRIAIIVDGLDECNSTDAQRKIIEIIAAAARDGSTPFCWAFFSRPYPHLQASFTLPDVAPVTHTTVLSISDDASAEIKLYLRDGFKNILQRRNISMNSQWPPDNDIQTLVKASNGLFIYAATVLRVVALAGSLEEALHAVCATASNRTANASEFPELDASYMLIMQRIPSDVLSTVLLLCRILCGDGSYAGAGGDRSNSSSIILLGNMLSLSEIEFRAICNHLAAVLYIHDHSDSLDFTQFGDTVRPFQHTNPAAAKELRMHVLRRLGGPIHFYHKSFCDFLQDPTRSGSFCVLSSSVHNACYRHYLEVVRKYEESYSFHGSGEVYPSFQFLVYILNATNQELALAPGVPDSASSLSWPYENELVNSVLKSWIYHRAFDYCFNFGRLPETERQSLRRFGCANFRKAQQNREMLFAGHSGFLELVRWDCHGHSKVTNDTWLFRITQKEFQAWFDVVKFKTFIKRWKECRVIQPYYPNFTSRLKSFVPKTSQDKLISGLYYLGPEFGSLFWYWEINPKEKYYQEFIAADFSEGERVYRDEQFDSWPTIS